MATMNELMVRKNRMVEGYMIKTYLNMCFQTKYRRVIAKSTGFIYDRFMYSMINAGWVEEFQNSDFGQMPENATEEDYCIALERYLAKKFNFSESDNFVTYSQNDFQDFLDFYSDYVILWTDYQKQNLIDPRVNFDMVRDDLVSLCDILAECGEIQDDFEYHNKAEEIFKNYLLNNGWLLDKEGSDAIFHEEKWYVDDLRSAVDQLKEDDLIPDTYEVDYENLGKYVKGKVFSDHTEENERILNAVEEYCKRKCSTCLSKEEINLFKDIVVNLAKSSSRNSMYQCFLKAHGWKQLSVEQIAEIVTHADGFDEDSFIEENLVGPRLEIWYSINNLSKISAL